MTPRSNVVPLRPSDQSMIEGPVAFVRLSRAADHTPPFGECLVRFFRRQQFRIFVACYVVAVATACYFAFQVGRGVL